MQNTNQCASCGASLTVTSRFCSSCGTPVTRTASAASSVSAGPSTTRKAARILIPALLAVGGALIWSFLTPSVHPVIREQPVVAEPRRQGSDSVSMFPVGSRVEDGDIILSLSDVTDHRLVRFEYLGGKTARPLLAYVAPDGRLVTAISVSEHCGSTEFRIKENRIYCAHCPSSWDIMTMEAFACCGRYYPDPIPSRIVGNEIRIRTDVVERWAGRL